MTRNDVNAIIAVSMLAFACNGCKSKKPCDDTPPVEPACVDGPAAEVECAPPSERTDLRAELDYRSGRQWSDVLERHGQRPEPPPGESNPDLRDVQTREIVEELRLQAEQEQGHIQQLVQACDAPEAIRRNMGGVAMLIDKGTLKLPPKGTKVVVELPSRPLSKRKYGICPSETGGDTLEIDSSNGGTLFFLDRRHLVGAGHLVLAELCDQAGTARLGDLVIAFGLTNQAVTPHGAIEVPIAQVIDGSTVTIVECHHGDHGNPVQQSEDWMLLRLDECACAAKPLTARWGNPVTEGEEVHTLGHPDQLTMKYSNPGTVEHSVPTVPIFRMDLVTTNGHSGAPIFDVAGNVVGIHNGNNPDCTSRCTVHEHATCCRRSKCSLDDCKGDGFATHIQQVEAALNKSRASIPWKECEEQ